MIQAIQLLLSLSILVVLHEFGHYITAKMFGCRVEKFYLFMDWKFAIFKRKIGETEFGLGWLPLGGYVKISGFVDESMDDSNLDTPPEPWELRAKPAWQRLIVMLGGVVVNILLAWFIYSMILFSWGETYMPIKALDDGFSFNEGGEMLGFVDGDILTAVDGAELIEYDPMSLASSILFEGAKEIQLIRSKKSMTLEIDPNSVNRVINDISSFSGNLIEPNIQWIVGGFVPGSLGEKHGLKVGDQITLVNKMKTSFYNNEIREYLQSQANQSILLTILRDGDIKELSVPLSEDGFLGVIPSTKKYEKTRSFSFLQSFPAGFVKTKNMTTMYWGQVKTIFNPKTGGYKHVGGVISIGKMFPGEWNWFVFWSMTALLSIILAIMNLLPIPALDGGHALIAIGEMLTGKKLPVKILMPLQVAGMVMLFALLIYANGMDVIRLFN